jgi:hypothetical protein
MVAYCKKYGWDNPDKLLVSLAQKSIKLTDGLDR